MRIIAGRHKRRNIETLKGNKIRPTSDFVREALFNVLEYGKLGNGRDFIEDANALDCFCGSGALGLEAISRGAGHVTFMDKSRDSLECARKNAERFGELEICAFLQQELPYLTEAQKQYSLVFLDPPYGSGLLKPTLKSLLKHGWLTEDALLVTERSASEHFSAPEGFTLVDERTYGQTIVGFLTLLVGSDQ